MLRGKFCGAQHRRRASVVVDFILYLPGCLLVAVWYLLSNPEVLADKGKKPGVWPGCPTIELV
jgi:hypothetical protein